MTDCVQKHPRNALGAWTMVLNGFNENENYLEAWVKEDAFKGLQNGRRNKSTGEYPDEADQSELISQRFSIDRLLDNIKTEDEAKKQACVAVFDKNGDKLKVKQATTKCSSGHSCATLDENGLFVSAAKHAEKQAKRSGQPAVARGYCVSSWEQTKSNLSNRSHRNEWLQKTEDIITRQRDKIHELKGDVKDSCRSKK